MISSPEEKHVVQICTSSISLIASSTIATMILTSPTGLSSPYKRIIFGLSISDIFQSFALLTGPFSPPSETPQSPWSHGNTATCDVNGFLMAFGSCAVPMYTCGLCIFYLCKLVYRMSDRQFAKRVEVYLHFGIVVFNVCVGLASLFTKTFNASPLAGFCYYAAFPQECNHPGSYNYGRCERGEHSFTFIFLSTITVPTLCLMGIFVSMGLIVCHSHRKAREFRAEYGQPLNRYVHQLQQQQRELHSEFLVRLYLREALIQSCLYVLGFVAVYIMPLIACLKLMINFRSIYNSPIPTLLVAFFPLGGLYNILVYTRPNVSSLRRTDANLSWLKAFILVIRAGGEVPSRTETSSCFLCFRSSNDDNKNRSSPSQISGIAKRGYYYSNRNPPAVERKSEVNMASLQGAQDFSSLYLEDFGNTDDKLFDVGGCFDSTTALERNEVNMASLHVKEDSSCLYLDDLGNTDVQVFDGGGCIESLNAPMDITGLEATSHSLERDEEGGKVIVGGCVVSEHFSDCSSSDKPAFLVRLEGGDISNISSIVWSGVSEVEDTKRFS